MSKMDHAERKYIRKRKRKAFIESIPFYMCRIFPIHKNKIVMWTFEGTGGYGCSPRYVAEELLNRNKNTEKEIEIIWLVEDTSKEFPEKIKKRKNTLWMRAYHMSTARFWVANTRSFYGTKKRCGTTYFQTWHGMLGLKPIGKYRGEKFSEIAYLVSKSDSALIDYVLSGCKWRTKMYPNGLVYDGEILETGNPRCDVLFSGVEQKHIQFRKEYNLPDDSKILLYAPTFRGGSQSTVRSVLAEAVSLDFNRLIYALEKRFGGKWYIFLRLHPQLIKNMKEMPVKKKNQRLVDVSGRPDMNEIIAAADAMITDYSSAIFEGLLTGQPCLIYADDLEDYIADRGDLMFDLNELPFPVASNNDELIKNILSFNQNEYKEKSIRFITQVGITEDGHASERLVDFMEDIW